QKVAPLAGIKGKTIMRQSYPAYDEKLMDKDAVEELEWIKQFIVGLRQIRSGMDIKPSKALPVLIQNGSATDKQRLETNETYIQSLAKTETITWLDNDDAPESATALVGDMKVLVPMAGLIDKDAELARLGKEIDKLQNDIQRVEGKLGNSKFVDKAPEAVVQKERNKLAEIKSALENLTEQKAKIEKL
ncbi:MAG: valine--tRNA ligase, partial [Gammaproteobacteria bacterium]|nr:valine--tRNA ligase [Gammaproteobacteria bacterium]